MFAADMKQEICIIITAKKFKVTEKQKELPLSK